MQGAGKMLCGRRVMIVEDEMLVAMELESVVADQGARVLGPAPNASRALALLEDERPDAAILDVNLNGTTAAPVAAALSALGVPFMLVTGYGGGQALQPELAGAPRLDKPVNHDQLVSTLGRLLEGTRAC